MNRKIIIALAIVGVIVMSTIAMGISAAPYQASPLEQGIKMACNDIDKAPLTAAKKLEIKQALLAQGIDCP